MVQDIIQRVYRTQEFVPSVLKALLNVQNSRQNY